MAWVLPVFCNLLELPEFIKKPERSTGGLFVCFLPMTSMWLLILLLFQGFSDCLIMVSKLVLNSIVYGCLEGRVYANLIMLQHHLYCLCFRDITQELIYFLFLYTK